MLKKEKKKERKKIRDSADNRVPDRTTAALLFEIPGVE